ncbi:MAG: hypothetical protein K0S18_280 [Anaerocolumna sp.]|jgi:hypothetical protein|nr:hypothetical protein [Anaerocolumna sp.]
MNKGLKIRNNKLKKKAQKRMVIKSNQISLCRFITIRWELIERINGKYQRTGNEKANGLQIKNKVYLINGKYKFINSKSIKILKTYSGVPDWANEYLTGLYNSHIE